MSSFLRSQDMGYYGLIVPREGSWEVFNELGFSNSLHFIDYNPGIPSTGREFSSQVKRCDEMLIKISFLKQEMSNFNKQIIKCDDIDEFLKRDFRKFIANYANISG